MPTYQYVCKRCGHLFEIVQSMKDETLTECPQCGGELRKVFTPPSIAFKGSGFYTTDHGKQSKKPSETKPSETKPSETKPSEAKPDGKEPGSGKKEPARTASGGTSPSGDSSGSRESGGSGDSGSSGGSRGSGSGSGSGSSGSTKNESAS
jgi:putative FmdB family regulatory protein